MPESGRKRVAAARHPLYPSGVPSRPPWRSRGAESFQVRRAHPLVFVAMWAVVALLAVAGFAAFQIGGRQAPQSSHADLGREVGALAGLGFNAPRVESAVAVSDSPIQDAAASDRALTRSTGADTSADTVPTHGWLSEMQVRSLVSKYFAPEDVNRAIRVAWCESRFNPDSNDPQTGGTGLFHHLPQFWSQRAEATGFSGAEPTDPEANVAAAAYAIYNEGGWAVFNCSP